MSKKKLAAISYLNAKPLVFAFENNLISHNFDLQFYVPAVCADKLIENQIDAGLIPTFEYANQSGRFQIVPDLCISSRGAVKSVCLFFKKNLQNIKTVALDTSSRTSVILTKIILQEKFMLNPNYIHAAPNLSEMLSRADAALIIGDQALTSLNSHSSVLDLGEEWTDMTGLPFVYAFWAGQPGALETNEINALQEAKQIGISHIEKIAREYAQKNGASGEIFQKYLTENIHFSLDENALDGLREFYEQAFFYGFIKGIPDLVFYQ